MSEFTNFKTLERPPKPNTYLVAPVNLCLADKPDATSPFLPARAGDVYASIKAIAANEKRWTLVKEDAGTRQLKIVARTPVLGFKDDLDVQVLQGEDENSATVAIYSRSRVGYSDFGANRKRVDALMTQLLAN